MRATPREWNARFIPNWPSACIERPLKYWEIIADNLKKAGWSLGWVSAVDCEGRTIWIVDAHRDDGKRFVVRADEKLTAFLELESYGPPIAGNCRLKASSLS
jgi:hypothetical protein